MELCYLLNNGGQTSKCKSAFIVSGNYGTAQFDNNALRLLQILAFVQSQVMVPNQRSVDLSVFT
jgi:hypothetical protein